MSFLEVVVIIGRGGLKGRGEDSVEGVKYLISLLISIIDLSC